MGVEKINRSGTMPYQGSAAVASTQNLSQSTEVVTATGGRDAAAVLTNVQPEKRNGKGKECHTEELNTAQGSQLKKAVSDLNKQMNNSEAVFGIHEKTNRVTIKIVDKASKEVIKEYPPEQTLDMIAKVWEIAGILVDEKR